LIEFGWDEPDTTFLRKNITAMERTPFDGCVFHVGYRTPTGEAGNFTWKVWGRRAFRPDEVAPALADLRATPRRRFTRLFLRVNVTPGDIDWFDDYAPVLGNLQLAAEIARRGGCRGLLLDTESYEAPLFEYRRQRDAGSRSWDEYAAQARRRGREAMEAVQRAFPRAEVFLTFGYELPWRESQQGARGLPEGRYGLLAPFLDGLVDGARTTRIIDGHEVSYGFKTPQQFQEVYAAAARDGLPPIVADPERQPQVTSVGFGLWMDYNWRRFGWDEKAHDRNYFTPETFEASLRAAREVADEYVWIYTETPRWWTDEGGSAHLPPEYDAAVRRAIER
jgi:hypothetical protein